MSEQGVQWLETKLGDLLRAWDVALPRRRAYDLLTWLHDEGGVAWKPRPARRRGGLRILDAESTPCDGGSR